MDWVGEFGGQTIGLDTAPLIYFIEQNPTYLSIVSPFFEAMDSQAISVVTSTITLLEVLVHPIRQDQPDLVRQYREILLRARGLAMLDLTPEIAEAAAHLRAGHDLRAPDAVQLAAAISANAVAFLTNDRRLTRVTELQVLILDDL